MIACDTETHLIGATCWERYRCPICGPAGFQAPRCVCVSWAALGGASGVFSAADAAAPEALRSALADGVVGHHIAFDLAVAVAMWPELLWDVIDAYNGGRVQCTMIRQKILDVARGHKKFRPIATGPKAGQITKSAYSLEVLARDMCGIALEKDTFRMRYPEVDGIPVDRWPPGFAQYAIADAASTLELWQFQDRYADLIVNAHAECRAAFWLQLSTVWGLRTDPEGARDLERALMAERDALTAELVQAGLMRLQKKAGQLVAVRDTKAAKAAMVRAYVALGKNVPMTDRGNVSLARVSCQDSEDDDLNEYSLLGAVGIILSKDVPVLRDNVTIHPKIDTILETGRVAYSKPCMGNLPRKPGVRECIIPRDGCAFLAADYSGFELATLAQAITDILGTGRSRLADMLNQGIDPHMVVAGQLLGLSYADAMAARATNPEIDARYRQIGKVANFGLPGGLSAETLVWYARQSYGVKITLAEAYAIKEAWLRTFPEMREYFAYCARIAEVGTLVQFRSGRIRGRARFTACANGFFQGPAADIAKAVGWEIMREEYTGTSALWRPGAGAPAAPGAGPGGPPAGAGVSPLFGSRTVLFVHDEFVLETPIATLGPCAERLEDLMVDGARPWLPDVRIGVEVTAMRRYAKKPGPGNKITIPTRPEGGWGAS